MQIHHLSLPLLASGKSDSTTALEGEDKKKKKGREVEESGGLVGRGVIRHCGLSPALAESALTLDMGSGMGA